MKKEIFDFYDRTSLKSYNLDRSMQDQLKALSSLDIFTRKHCENVAAIVCRLCEYLNCSKGFTEYCTICAYLHDIGKIFISPSILQKPGKLTNEEYSEIKKHTTIGYEMCMKDSALRPYAAGTYYHHEALDGSGYPQGLLKKDIPYEAQIIRVADEYDAITSKRQYKSHIGISDTLKIIIENTKPQESISRSGALQEIVHHTKLGRDNPIIVKALIKVVIDDIEYEIYCAQNYLKYLQENLKRFKYVHKYYDKMLSTKNESTKEYFLEYAKTYLAKEENINNFEQIEQEYIEAVKIKKEAISNLYNEIGIIKKLKI